MYVLDMDSEPFCHRKNVTSETGEGDTREMKGTLYASTMTLEFYATGGPRGGGPGPYTTLLDKALHLANA